MPDSPDKNAIADEHATKHDRVVEYLDSHELDAVVLSRRCNFSWYTCGAHNYVSNASDVGNSYLVVTREGAKVLANNIEATRLGEEELADSPIDVSSFSYADSAERAEAFTAAVRSGRIAVDAPVSGFKAVELGKDFDRLRWTLTSWEIQRYRSLCNDVVAGVESAARVVQAGQSENELAAQLSGELYKRGCVPWVLLVGSDDRIAKHRHPLATDKIVHNYAMLVACAERHGLIAACTRLVSFGPIPQELDRKHRAVATVDTALISATKPGVTLGELFSEAQQAYAAVGFPDQWRLHHQGGSCGYLPREVKASPAEETVVLADQAFAWNPSIAGTKSEDTILCCQEGSQLLAEATDWPTIAAEWKGAALPRPAILIK